MVSYVRTDFALFCSLLFLSGPLPDMYPPIGICLGRDAKVACGHPTRVESCGRIHSDRLVAHLYLDPDRTQ